MFKFSAEDIANQTFQSKFRGYDPEQVHEFLDVLARQWQKIQESHRELDAEFDEQTRELREYRRREKSLARALETARQVAEEIRHQADRDAEMVLADTELKAERMLAKAESRVSELQNEIFDLQQQRLRLQNEMRQMLGKFSAMLDEYDERWGQEEPHPLPPVPTKGSQLSAGDDGQDEAEEENSPSEVGAEEQVAH